MTDKTAQELRALAEDVRDWLSPEFWPEDIEPDDDDLGISVVGSIDEDGNKWPIAVIDADTYGHEGESLKLSKFYAAANPVAVIALLDRIAQLEAERDALKSEMLEQSRIIGMSAEREMALRAQLAQRQVPADVKWPDPIAYALEWTFDGEERGMRLYDDETHCRFDAESDGGFCHLLFTEEQVRAMLAASPTPPRLEMKADMFWDASNPERCEDTLHNCVVEAYSDSELAVGDIVTIQRATKLPNIQVRITQIEGEDGAGELDYEEIEAAHGIKGEDQ